MNGGGREIAARLSWQTACELGFRRSLAEWERPMKDIAPGCTGMNSGGQNARSPGRAVQDVPPVGA